MTRAGKSDGIPTGWVQVPLRDVTEVSKEKREPEEFKVSYEYIGLEHIQSSSGSLIGRGDIEAVKSTKSFFRKGAILYGKLRPYLRKVCKAEFDGVCSTDILVYPEVEGLDNSYLFHFLLTNTTAEYANRNSSGINLPRISAKKLGEIDFPLPPENEQPRIVDAIESLQQRSNRARTLLTEVRPKLDQLRQSILQAAFSGRLTADWRAKNPNVEPAEQLLARIRTERRRRWETAELEKFEAKGKKPPKNWKDKYKEPEPVDDSELPELPERWCWAAAEELVEPSIDIVYGIVQPGPNLDEGIPYVRGLDIQNGTILVDQLWNTSKEIAERYIRSSLKGGDVLLGIIRHTKVAVVPDALSGGNMGRATARFRPSSIIQSSFLAGALDSPEIQKWLLSQSRGMDMPIINVGDVRRTPVPLAPLDEQNEIVETLAVAMKSISRTSVDVDSLGTSLVQLDQSILSKAFRGELVPQDPNDEPATDLLYRIRTARKAEAPAEKISKNKTNGKRKERKSHSKRRDTSVNKQQQQLRDWILSQNSQKTFTFEQIRSNTTTDYESLKAMLFLLLDEQPAILEQVFDQKKREVAFVRISK